MSTPAANQDTELVRNQQGENTEIKKNIRAIKDGKTHEQDVSIQYLVQKYFSGELFNKKSRFLCVNDDPIDGAIRALAYARNNVDLAEKYIQSNLEWREKNQIDQILDRPIDPVKVALVRSAFSDGFYGEDLEGYPIYWCPAGLIDMAELQAKVGLEDMTRFHIQMMEFNQRMYLREHSRRAKRSIHNFTCVVDLKGFSPRQLNKSFRECLSHVTTIDRDYYHDNFHRVIVINAPFVIRMFWRTISPFFRTETQSKFLFLNKPEQLFEYVSREVTPKLFGGTNEREDILFTNNNKNSPASETATSTTRTTSTMYSRRIDRYIACRAAGQTGCEDQIDSDTEQKEES